MRWRWRTSVETLVGSGRLPDHENDAERFTRTLDALMATVRRDDLKSVEWDALIIGAGPAGLTAAIYLARFRRKFLVVHDETSRAGWIPLSRNHPGFPDGIAGKVLLDRMKRQAARYGTEFLRGSVSKLQQRESGFTAMVGSVHLRAKTVLLATGVIDYGPNLPHVQDAVRHGRLRICPICDGYEVEGRPVGVIGNDGRGVREAVFLKTYTDDICLLHVGPADALSSDDRALLAYADIRLIETSVHDIDFADDGRQVICHHQQGSHPFYALYSALGTRPRSELAEQLGVKLSVDGRLEVDAHQQTSIAGLYAAGDLVHGLNQISTAEGEGATAATAMHNLLRR
jgi:thioredoxin reductase (NADPH)